MIFNSRRLYLWGSNGIIFSCGIKVRGNCSKGIVLGRLVIIVFDWSMW